MDVAEDAPKARVGPNFELYNQGRYVYERNCLICHGDRGDGNGEVAKDLPLKPRSFREGWFKFRSTPMVRFSETLSAEHRWDLAAYVLGLRSDKPQPTVP